MDRGRRLETGCATTRGMGAGRRASAAGVGGYKGLPLCTSSFYLLFEMARRERKRKAREEETTRRGRGERVDG